MIFLKNIWILLKILNIRLAVKNELCKDLKFYEV